jgi:nucleoside-diphosphate-sugar epimerase
MLQVDEDGTRPYARALRNILDEVARPELEKYVWTGTTAVYGDRPGAVLDESAPITVMNAMGAATREMEEIIEQVGRERAIPWVILRVPGIAAPERATLWTLVRQGRFTILGNPDAVTPMIHVDDLAEACILAAVHGTPGSYYNLNSDEVMTTGEFWTYSAERMGVPPPPIVPEDQLTEQQRPMRVLAMNVSNAKAKRELGLTLRYPSHRAIADAILATLPPA